MLRSADSTMISPINCAATISLFVCLGCGDSGLTSVEVGDRRLFTDHVEMDVRFENGGAVLSGTIYLPLGEGPFPAVAVHPGSSWTTRATWQEVQPQVIVLGGAILSWDKRGQGGSGGSCCPADLDAHFALLADDLVAAARALREIPSVDPLRIGVVGSSFGGWIVPLAANAAPDVISFTLVTVGGVVSTGQEGLYDELTGYAECEPTGTPMDQIIDQLKAAGPSGFDPRASLEALVQPGLWIYGGNDLSHPTVLSVEMLEEVRDASGKDWTIEVFPTANHELIDNGEICQADGPLVEGVLPRMSEWVARVLGE